MKRLFVILMVFLMVLMVKQDQLAADIGIKGGINLAKLRFSQENADDWKSKPQFQLGIFYDFKIIKFIFIQPELHYVIKGATLSHTYLGMEITSTVKLHYIEFPLLIKFVLPGDGPFQPGLFVGGYWAIKTNAKTILEYNNERVKEDIKEQIKNFNYGLVAGVGAHWSLGKGKLVLDIRYNLGLISIKKLVIEDYNVKDKSITFMIGYSF